MKYSFFLIAALLFISIAQSQVNPPSVKISNQIWMVKNLDVDHYRNGDPIPEVKDSAAWSKLTTGAWCYYNNDPANGKIYGKLYNGYAVNDSRALAPKGWHLPSDSEWTTLINFLGGEEVAGGAMKETGTTHWAAPNTGATNSSGFSGLPGGSRGGDGSFSDVGNFGDWWGYPVDATTGAWSRGLYYNIGLVDRFSLYKHGGFSVRCVKD